MPDPLSALKSLDKFLGMINKVLAVFVCAIHGGMCIGSGAEFFGVTFEMPKRNKRGAVGRSNGLVIGSGNKASEAGKFDHRELHPEGLLNSFNLSCVGLGYDSWFLFLGGEDTGQSDSVIYQRLPVTRTSAVDR